MTATRTRPVVREEPTHGELVETTYVQIRDRIVRGALEPDARLVEASLALELGISRTPVREALGRLERERYAVPVSNGRRIELAVAPVSDDGVRELWTLIATLESVAIARVADMGRSARRQLAAAMAEVNDELERAAARRPRDADAIASLMSEFHQIFVDACAGPYLQAVYEPLRCHVQRYERAYGQQSQADFQESVRDHREIVDAVGDGRVERAQALILSHWERGVARTMAQLRKASRA